LFSVTAQNLHTDSEFLVKDAKTSNLVIGIILVFFFLVTVTTSNGNNIEVVALFLIPAGFFLFKASKNKTIMRINKTGFYYYDRLETDWQHFHSAHVSHNEEIVGSINDNFLLMLQYYSPENGRLYRTRIPLTNAQDKAEEEIIAAIDFYYQAHRAGKSVFTESVAALPDENQS
jgi:hypothetical protein